MQMENELKPKSHTESLFRIFGYFSFIWRRLDYPKNEFRKSTTIDP